MHVMHGRMARHRHGDKTYAVGRIRKINVQPFG